MARNSRYSSEDVDSLFVGKTYREGIKELVKTTAVRAGDFDQKALLLLDALEVKGKSKDAVGHVKKALKAATTRASVSNWRGYVYTLLRQFDEETYAAMKAEQGSDRRRTRGEKRFEGRERRATRDSAADEDGDCDGEETTKNGGAPDAKSAPGVKKPPSPTTAAKMNQAAPEFSPGKMWKGQNGHGSRAKVMAPTAAEFVPGEPWGGGVHPAALSHGAPEFVPGQHLWDCAPGSPFGPAPPFVGTDATRAGFHVAAPPFVPGQAWSHGPCAPYHPMQPPAGRKGSGSLAAQAPKKRAQGKAEAINGAKGGKGAGTGTAKKGQAAGAANGKGGPALEGESKGNGFDSPKKEVAAVAGGSKIVDGKADQKDPQKSGGAVEAAGVNCQAVTAVASVVAVAAAFLFVNRRRMAS